jgi:putative ABC transport system permease protein
MLLKSPGFTAVAVFTLALGSGANTAIFTVVSAVLLRPLPYADPDRLVALLGVRPDQTYSTLSPLNFMDLASQSEVFSGAAAIETGELNLTGRGDPERVVAAAVSQNFFAVVGLEPALGRSFAPREGRAGGAAVAVLGYGLWQRRFGAGPGILGTEVRLDGRSYTVVGVAPPGFDYPEKGRNLAAAGFHP